MSTNNPNDPKFARATSPAPAKEPYTRPVLRVLGTVRSMTQAISGPSLGDAGAMAMAPSARALKENVVRVGTHPIGVGLYAFSYRPEFRERFGHRRQIGVMADEVEQVLP